MVDTGLFILVLIMIIGIFLLGYCNTVRYW